MRRPLRQPQQQRWHKARSAAAPLEDCALSTAAPILLSLMAVSRRCATNTPYAPLYKCVLQWLGGLHLRQHRVAPRPRQLLLLRVVLLQRLLLLRTLYL